MIGTAAGTIATILAGAVATLDYVHGLETAQVQQRAEWAAKAAVLDYRVGEVERDIDALRQQHQHDIDQIRQECSP